MVTTSGRGGTGGCLKWQGSWLVDLSILSVVVTATVMTGTAGSAIGEGSSIFAGSEALGRAGGSRSGVVCVGVCGSSQFSILLCARVGVALESLWPEFSVGTQG